jgi:hypothetical protein
MDTDMRIQSGTTGMAMLRYVIIGKREQRDENSRASTSEEDR